MLFDRAGAIAAVAQKEHRQIYPRPGWVEHDAEEIWANVAEVTAGAQDLFGTHQGSSGAGQGQWQLRPHLAGQAGGDERPGESVRPAIAAAARLNERGITTAAGGAWQSVECAPAWLATRAPLTRLQCGTGERKFALARP